MHRSLGHKQGKEDLSAGSGPTQVRMGGLDTGGQMPVLVNGSLEGVRRQPEGVEGKTRGLKSTLLRRGSRGIGLVLEERFIK